MKKNVILTISILINVVSLGTLLLYQYTPVFDFIVINKSKVRLCELFQESGKTDVPLCKF
jgi:hypothetical protein